jgi:hypothetical protein
MTSRIFLLIVLVSEFQPLKFCLYGLEKYDFFALNSFSSIQIQLILLNAWINEQTEFLSSHESYNPTKLISKCWISIFALDSTKHDQTKSRVLFQNSEINFFILVDMKYSKTKLPLIWKKKTFKTRLRLFILFMKQIILRPVTFKGKSKKF